MEEYIHGMTRSRFESLLTLVDRDWRRSLRAGSVVSSSSDGPASMEPTFRPELVLAHCFRQFRRKKSHQQPCRRRIFILPRKADALDAPARRPPQPPPEPISSYKEILKIPQEEPESASTWLRRRLKLRQDLETFGDPQKWLQNKNDVTTLEAKVLHGLHLEHQERLKEQQMVTVHKKRLLPPLLRVTPQLLLPTPLVLPHLFFFLHFHKLRLQDVFHRKELRRRSYIPREEFLQALRTVGAPLKQQEMEDLVIYLSSLSKNNTITMSNLDVCYKQWILSDRRNTLFTWRQQYVSAKRKTLKAGVAKGPPKMDLLTVPTVDTKPESLPMTQEEREEVNRQYRERRQKTKDMKRPFPQLRDSKGGLSLVMSGDMKDFLSHFRQENFLVYLQCRKACEYYGIKLTKEVLMKALLYPGDKVIFQEDHEHRIRQPGGYYDDLLGQKYLGTKRKAEKAPRKAKEMHFWEFEDFLSDKTSELLQRTDPNAFWPGHLLDKLRLYLPTMSRDRSLVLFSSVRAQPPAYPATYHPDRWWPVKNNCYVTYGNFDATKVYFID